MSNAKITKYVLGVVVSVSLSACTFDNWYQQDRAEPHYRGHHTRPVAHQKAEMKRQHHEEKMTQHHRAHTMAKKTPVATKRVVQPSAPGPVRQAAPQIPVIQ